MAESSHEPGAGPSQHPRRRKRERGLHSKRVAAGSEFPSSRPDELSIPRKESSLFERVLVPLDGSPFAEFALAPGLGVARRAGSRLELVTVAEPPVPGSGGREEDAVEEGARRYLEERKDALPEGWGEERTELTILRGPVSERLEERARETGADLVVMASHGRGGLSRLWLGSATDELIRHAPCPVLVVRPEEGEEPAPERDFRPERILVPVDRTEVSTSVLEVAVEAGRLFGARFRLMHAVSYPAEKIHPYLTQASRMDDRWLRETLDEAERRLEEVAGRIRSRGVDADVEVRRADNPAVGILDAAREWGADLVAMGTHGRGGIPRTILGSVADKVVRAADGPVLLQRPGDDGDGG